MEVWELEAEAWRRDHIRVVIRAARNVVVGDYAGQNAAQGTMRVSQYRDRISQHLNGLELSVIDGHGSEPVGQTQLNTVRASYDR